MNTPSPQTDRSTVSSSNRGRPTKAATKRTAAKRDASGPVTPSPRPKVTVLGEPASLRAFLDRPPMEWLVDDWLPCRSLSTVYGNVESGKSLVAIGIGFAIA